MCGLTSLKTILTRQLRLLVCVYLCRFQSLYASLSLSTCVCTSVCVCLLAFPWSKRSMPAAHWLQHSSGMLNRVHQFCFNTSRNEKQPSDKRLSLKVFHTCLCFARNINRSDVAATAGSSNYCSV